MVKTKLELKVGNKRICPDVEKYSQAKIRELSKEIAIIQDKHSLLTKYPMEHEESPEKWYDRILPLLLEKTKKLDGESDADYLDRATKDSMEDHISTIGYEVVIAICKVFGVNESQTPTMAEMEEGASWPTTREFLYDFLILGDLIRQAELFFPQKRFNQQ